MRKFSVGYPCEARINVITDHMRSHMCVKCNRFWNVGDVVKGRYYPDDAMFVFEGMFFFNDEYTLIKFY